jgi:Leucine-rich repeat (LRR) protein
VLPALRSLKSLRLRQLDSAPRSLWPALTALTALTVLDLHHSQLSDSDAIALASISALRALQHLDIGNPPEAAETGDCIHSGLRTLASSIGECTALTYLNIAAADVSTAGERPLAAALAGLDRLRHLDVSSTGLHSPAAVVVLGALDSHRAVTRLSLAGNLLSASTSVLAMNPDGMAAEQEGATQRAGDVGVRLAALDTLRWLDVQSAMLYRDAVAAFAPHLAKLTALKHLNLAGNTLGQHAGNAAALANALTALTALTHLDASDGVLHDGDVATHIAPALACLTRLRDLGLGRNRIRAHGATVLAWAVRHGLTALTSLSLHRNEICNGNLAAGARAIFEATRGMPGGKQLALQDNGVRAVPGLEKELRPFMTACRAGTVAQPRGHACAA